MDDGLNNKNLMFGDDLNTSVKRGGGSIMSWVCFAASGPGRLAVIDRAVNSELNTQLLQKNQNQNM